MSVLQITILLFRTKVQTFPTIPDSYFICIAPSLIKVLSLHLQGKVSSWQTLSQLLTGIGLIRVKEEGQTGFSRGWQDCSEGFPMGKARGKS